MVSILFMDDQASWKDSYEIFNLQDWDKGHLNFHKHSFLSWEFKLVTESHKLCKAPCLLWPVGLTLSRLWNAFLLQNTRMIQVTWSDGIKNSE